MGLGNSKCFKSTQSVSSNKNSEQNPIQNPQPKPQTITNPNPSPEPQPLSLINPNASQYPTFEQIYQSLDRTKINQLKRYDELLKNDPNNIEHLNSKADICEKLGRTKEYLECMLKIKNLISSNELDAEIHRYILKFQKCKEILKKGSNSQKNCQNDLAIGFYNMALEIDCNNMDAIISKMVSYESNNQIQEAISTGIEALKVDPEQFDAWYNLGTTMFIVGQEKNAIDFFVEALKINPNSVKSMNNIGLCYKDIGQKHKAVEFFKKAIELDPNNPHQYNNLGLTYKEMNEIEHKEIDKIYDKAIELSPNFTITWYNKAKLLEDMGNYDEAIACFNKTLELVNRELSINPNNDKALILRAFVLQDLDKQDEAIADLNKVQSVSLIDLAAGLKFKAEVTKNLNKEIKIAESIIHNKEIASKQPEFVKKVEESIKKIKTIKEEDKNTNSEVIAKLMSENANTQAAMQQLTKNFEIQHKAYMELQKIVISLKESSDKTKDITNMQVCSIEISYENKLLNHPNLLKKCVGNNLSPSKILDLSTMLSHELIDYAIANQDYEMVLAGLISVDNQ